MGDDKNELMGPDQMQELLSGTMGSPTSMLDTLSVFRAGKDDYFKRGDDKVDAVFGVLLFSQRPTRSWWQSRDLTGDAPDCWSLDGVHPHVTSKMVQADRCAGCKQDQFGTAAIGRGKACKTRAADFVLQVREPEGLAGITKTAIPVVRLEEKAVLGEALIQYGIGNKDSSESWQRLIRFAKERETPPQALICRWGFKKSVSKSNVEFASVEVVPVAKISADDFGRLIIPKVKDLKDGSAMNILLALSGAGRTEEPREPGSDG